MPTAESRKTLWKRSSLASSAAVRSATNDPGADTAPARPRGPMGRGAPRGGGQAAGLAPHEPVPLGHGDCSPRGGRQLLHPPDHQSQDGGRVSFGGGNILLGGEKTGQVVPI